MAIDTRFPDWILPKSEPWQVIAHTGEVISNALARQREFKLRADAIAQETQVRQREYDLREQQMTVMNQARLNDMAEQERALRDAERLSVYFKTGQLPGALESAKSYDHMNRIDLMKSRSELGRQTAADMADFNRRLAKVDARDRFAISEAMRKGAPAAEVWDALSTAEARQRELLQETRQFAPDALQKAVDYARQMEKLGDVKVTELAWERAATIARGGKLTGTKAAPTQQAGEKKESFLNRVKEFFGFGAPTAGTTAAPAAAAAATLPQGMTAAQAIEQANAAIRSGAPREAVMQRLKGMGIAVEEEGNVPTAEVQDAISQMVREALEAKPISP